MMRVTLCGLAFLAAVAAHAQDRPDEKAPPDRKAAELKWARGVAVDFVNAAAVGQNLVAAEVLLTEAFRKAALVTNDSAALPLCRLGFGTEKRPTWTIDREEIAPDSDEAVFRGVFKHGQGDSDLTVRVVMEKESGKWRVHFYDLGPVRKAAEKPAP